MTVVQRLQRSIQIEDAVLAGLLVLEPLLAGRSSSTAVGFLDRGPDILGGSIAVVAAIGAIVCLATRLPGQSTLDPQHAIARRPVDTEARYAFIGPFLGAIALVAGEGSRKLGIGDGGLLTGVAFLVGVAAFALADRLPVVSAPVRRALIAPFVLVCAAIFQEFVSSLTRGITAADLPVWGGLLVLGAAVFYSMLIYAPRELADPDAEGHSWLVRFGVFVVFTGIGLAIRPAG
jgi:hypothetical protein